MILLRPIGCLTYTSSLNHTCRVFKTYTIIWRPFGFSMTQLWLRKFWYFVAWCLMSAKQKVDREEKCRTYGYERTQVSSRACVYAQEDTMKPIPHFPIWLWERLQHCRKWSALALDLGIRACKGESQGRIGYQNGFDLNARRPRDGNR